MPKPRGKEHTTLTETAALVVRIISKIPHIKMIAPGEIKTASRRKTGKRHLTIVHTTAGLELIITGQSVQKIAIHTDEQTLVSQELQKAKALTSFAIKERVRQPGI